MRNLLQEFKEFAVKGNVIEIAIGFVLAAAFGAVVSSLVENVIMPVVAGIFGQPDFSELSIILRGEGEEATRLMYGTFFNAVVNFVLVAFALFVFVVKPYNQIKARQEEGEEDAPPPPEDVQLLREIRDALTTNR